MGLTDHIRSIPPRFASDGYSALAIDWLSEEGGTTAVGGEAEATAALGQAPPERLIADLRAGIDELERRERNAKRAVIGFCFGGGLTWQLLAAGEPRLAAAAPFYGPAPANPDFSGSKAAVLAVYGELDSRVNATRDGAVAARSSRSEARGPDVPGRGPRVLQRHRPALQRRRRDRGVPGGPELVLDAPGMTTCALGGYEVNRARRHLRTRRPAVTLRTYVPPSEGVLT